MIDTKAIRAAAEAARGLPEGDWNYEPRWQTVWNGRKHMVCDIRGRGHLGNLPNGAELQDAMGRHIANMNPATVIALLDRLEAAEAEVLEQARLLGIGGEKELALMAKLEATEAQLAIYEKHGVTCQTFRHKLTGCAECNRDDFAAMKEQK